jgi:Holliday junction resolvase
MKALTVFVCAVVVAAASVLALAHQETFKGKVIAVEQAGVRVNVVDPKTKKETPTTFEVDAETKVLRGDALVTFAGAKIQRNENIAVTVDHDLDVGLALVIRLDPVR